MEKVGFIGLGEMGLPMAVNLQKAGYQVFAFDVDTKCYEITEKYGIASCKSPEEVARKADRTVISIVRNFKQTEDVLFGNNGICASGKQGLNIIIMSTLDPTSMKLLEEKVTKYGDYLIDAPISGAKSASEAGTLTIMVAGPENVCASCQGIFQAMGKNIFNFGPQVGAGQAAKLTNNLLLGLNMAAYAEAMGFAQKSNLPMDTITKLITVSTGNSWIAQKQNWDICREEIVYKDMFALLKECAETHYSLPLGSLAFQLILDVRKKYN